MEMMEGPVEGMKYDSEDSPNSISPLPPVLRHGLGAVTTFGFLSFFASLGLFAFLTYKLIIWQILPPGEQEESPVSSEPESPTASDVNGFLVPKTAYREEWPPPPPSPRETKATFMSRIRREAPNQFLILIYNLLFADIQQAVAFMLNVEWLTKDSIDVGTPTCWAQGWFVSVGDLASSVFIAAIGVHTYLGVIKNYRVPTWGFYLAIVGMWSFVYGVTMLGVLVTDNGVNDGGYYVRAGAWCWVNPAYQDLRLYTHYLWIFLALALTWAIYLVIFFHLRFHSKHSPTCCMASSASSIATGRRGSNATISQADHYPNPDPNGPSPPPLLIPPSPSRSTMTDMTTKRLPPIPRSARHPTFLLYPIIYMLCTTPLAAGRIASMAGRDVKLAYFCYAGSMIASAGWLDVLLYSWTRRSIVFSGGAPPSQDTGLETFAFMRTPEGRQFGNVVFVSGGDGGAKCQQEKRWKRWNEKVVAGASLRTLRGDNIKMASKDSLRGFGMGAGEVMGMAIQCETVTTVSVEQVDQTPTPSRAESRSGNEKDGGVK